MPGYFRKIDLLKGLKPKGIFLLNTTWPSEKLSNLLPSKIKQYMAENDIQFYIINAYRLTQEVGIPGKVGTCMLAAFLN